MQLKGSRKNTVYLATGSLQDTWGHIFQVLELEVTRNLDDWPGYILCESLSQIDQSIEWETKIFCLKFPTAAEWNLPHARFFVGTFDKEVLNYEWGESYISRAFSVPSLFSLEGHNAPKAFRWNCAHPLSFGLFSDQIFIELESANFQIDQIKRYLDQFFFLYLMLEKSDVLKAALEIELIIGESWVSLQLTGAAKTFWREYVEAALGSGEGFAGSLERLREQTFALELIHLKSSEKLCFTSIFTKDFKSNHAFVMQNIVAFKEKKEASWQAPSRLKEAQAPQNELIKAPGPRKLDDERKLSLMKRIVQFLKRKIEPSELKSLTYEGLIERIKTYPKQKQIRNLLEADLLFILSCLKDQGLHEGLNHSFGELYKKEANDEFMDEIVERLEALTLEDAGELVFDGTQEFDETLTRVRGWIPEAESSVVVKGAKATKEEVRIIKGDGQDLAADDRYINEIKHLQTGTSTESEKEEFSLSRAEFQSKATELWQVKKGQIAAKVKAEVSLLRSSGANIETVAAKVKEIVASELAIANEDCDHLVAGLVEASSEPLLESKLGRSSEEVKSELEHLKFDLELAKRDDQLRRMKRIIDSMKEQIAKTSVEKVADEKSAKSETLAEEREWQGRLRLLEGENEELRRNLKALEIKHDRTEQQLKIEEEAASEPAPDVISADVAKEMIERASERNQQLVAATEAKLHTAETRIEVMSSKLDLQKQSLEEANSLRAAAESRSNMSSAAMSKFKAKAESLERKTKQLEELLAQKEKELEAYASNAGKNDIPGEEIQALVEAQEKEIEELKKNLAEAEQNLKGSLLKNKQYEQKAKFMTSQLDEAKKKLAGGTGGSSVGASNNQQQEHKLKQLEMINKKTDAALQKVSQELTDKKKEVLDLKKENTALQNKIKELERKMPKNAA